MKPKHNVFAQIRALEKRKQLKLYMYAIIDEKGNVIEKYRLWITADKGRKELQKDHYQKLKMVKLDEYGKPVVTKER